MSLWFSTKLWVKTGVKNLVRQLEYEIGPPFSWLAKSYEPKSYVPPTTEEIAMLAAFRTKGRQVDFRRVAEEGVWEGLPKTGNPVAVVLPHGAKICATGLVIQQKLEIDQWLEIGQQLGTFAKVLQWAIGDWWVYGYHCYGDRKAIATARKLPYEFGSLMNLGRVARSVAISRRNEVLSFSHHVAIAACEAEDQEKWLVKAEAKKMSVSALREAVQRQKSRDLEIALTAGGEEAINILRRDVNYYECEFERKARLASGGVCRIASSEIDVSMLRHSSDAKIGQLIIASREASDTWKTIEEKLQQHLRARSDGSQPKRGNKHNAKVARKECAA